MSDVRWLAAHQVARLYAVSLAYVRKLACKLAWRRIVLGRQVAYLRTDVEAWHEARTR